MPGCRSDPVKAARELAGWEGRPPGGPQAHMPDHAEIVEAKGGIATHVDRPERCAG